MKPTYIDNANAFLSTITFGETRESRVLEFKGRYGSGADQTFELRKDVLSLANTFGGALVIGVNESNDGGYRRALEPSDVNVEAVMQWISRTVTQRLHPVPDYAFKPLTILHAEANVRVLVVNIHPFPDSIAGYYCQGTDEALLYPTRDDFGVRFLRAEEVDEVMTNARIRRVEVALNEIAVVNQQVIVASPVYVSRPERDVEYFSRVQRDYNVTTGLSTGVDHPELPRKHVESPIGDGIPVFLRSFAKRQLSIGFGGTNEVSIPFGVIKEIWSHSANTLGLLLDCEIVVPEGRGSVRLRAYPARA